VFDVLLLRYIHSQYGTSLKFVGCDLLSAASDLLCFLLVNIVIRI